MRADKRQEAFWPEHRNPWDQQRGESPKAYKAFITYRDLGIGRTFKDLKLLLYPGGTGGMGRFAEWCQEYDWKGRAAAWDAEADRVKQTAYHEEIVATTKRQVQQARVAATTLTQFNAELMRRMQADPTALHNLDLETLARLITRAAGPLARVQLAERQALIGGNGMLPDKLAGSEDGEDVNSDPVVVIEVTDDGEEEGGNPDPAEQAAESDIP